MEDDPKRDAKRAMELAKSLGREAGNYSSLGADPLRGMMRQGLGNKLGSKG